MKGDLVGKLEAMLEAEAALTLAIDKVSPWLEAAPVNPHHYRVRSIPQSMEQVNHVLAYARVLAARTSAPAGWNPNAPVVGFSTPSPMPHQLRGGALAALQLEMARKQLLEQSRKRQLQETQSKSTKEDEKPQPMDVAEYESSTGARDPKRREVHAHERQVDAVSSAPQRAARPATQQDVSMNLSDSSSDEDDD